MGRELAAAYLRTVLSHSVEGMIVLDEQGSPVMWNDRYLDLWGLSDDILDRSLTDDRLKIMSGHARDPEYFFSRYRDIITRPDEHLRFEITLNTGGVLEASAVPILDDERSRVGQLISFHDVTEYRSAEQHRNFLAQHDPITGFLNRPALYERIEHLIQGSRPTGVRHTCGIISLDLPHFTRVVEEHGYRFGDRLLARIADRLDGAVGKEGWIARHADAEFIIHAANMSETDLTRLAASAVTSLTEPISLGDTSFQLVAHAGVSMFPRDGDTLEDLVGKAAIARKQAASGAHDVVFFSEQFGRQLAERLEFERDLEQALDRDEFFLVYQPFFDLHTGGVVACEALLRWNRRGSEVVSPMEFIPLAEHTGLIVDIGEWVLRKACTQAKQWQEQDGHPIPVSVNVSARQLEEPNFADTVARILREADLPPHLLQLELTESMRIRDTSQVADLIEQILDLGVRVSLDDYGTGYTNLSYLKKFKFVTLKVDRSFTQGLGESLRANMLMEAAIAIAKKVGLTLLAEGVETEEQLSFLREAGADQVQGFLLAPPSHPEEVTKFFGGYPSLTP